MLTSLEMFRFRYSVALWAAGCALAGAFPTNSPKPARGRAPQYTAEARQARQQGTVVLSVRVDETGSPAEVRVVSPLGYGLDQQAVEAVRSWRFAHGRLDGLSQAYWTTVKVEFRLAGAWFDARQEEYRTRFHQAEHAGDRAALEELAKRNYPPAQHRWGREVELRDREEALRLYTAAAAAGHPGALYELGRLNWGSPEALAQLTDASALGETAAQQFLGERFAAGEGVEQDRARAARHFRLCAMAGDTQCRLRLASLLEDVGEPRLRWQAVAWLELAAAQGSEEAGQRLQAKPAPADARPAIDAFKRQFEATALARR